MCDKGRKCCNDAVEKIIGNMTAEMQNNDGQYIPLGFTPAPSSAEPLNWTQPSNSYVNHYNMHYPESHASHNTPVNQFQQPQMNFTPQSAQFFEPVYTKNIDLSEYDNFNSRPNSTPGSLYNNYLSQNILPDHISTPQASSRTHLIENLVGNWMIPNNSGTYSPFGNPEAYKTNVFDLPNHDVIIPSDEMKYKQGIEQNLNDNQFNFNRGVRKPRMVAEVKPMRPSYSDVLTKPVPPATTKPLKSETKETKPKKDGKKNAKNEKLPKANTTLNRSNTNNEIKDIPVDKSLPGKNDKKLNKPNQLNRKWASLDNISEPQTSKIEDVKKRKPEENVNKSFNKSNKNKINKTIDDITDVEPDNIKMETFNNTKNILKKTSKINTRQKQNESSMNIERPPGKRNQRARKKENPVMFGAVGMRIKHYMKRWWKIFTIFIFWLFHLISDICSLSIHISRDVAVNCWSWLCVNWLLFLDTTAAVLKRIRFFTWIWEKFKNKKKSHIEDDKHSFSHCGLDVNINMPTTGDEAMKRLLACKGKDPYSILGVTPTCTDDDIKKYYKRQAFLVHPDKNNQPGAEEAFKILVHAFDMIGTSERRASYDRGVVESVHVVQAWREVTELLQQLHQKVEAAATTIRCSACGSRHKRTKIDRPSYAARNCNTCKIHHSAREGDIWAEARCFGFLWHYYACMEGSVFDITEWAGCQKESLKHLKSDSHHVQYRIALGKQNNNNNQPRRHSTSPRTERPDLENLLNSLYGQNESNARRRNKNKK